MLGMFYILSMTSHVQGGHRGAESPPCALHHVQQGFIGGHQPPLFRVWGSALGKKKIGRYFLMGGPAHGFVQGFIHGFGA